MSARAWLWVGTVLDLILLPPALYMAYAAAELARISDRAPITLGLVGLFLVLPVFCVVLPAAAWRASKRGRPTAQIVAFFAEPYVFAGFLVVVLYYGG